MFISFDTHISQSHWQLTFWLSNQTHSSVQTQDPVLLLIPMVQLCTGWLLLPVNILRYHGSTQIAKQRLTKVSSWSISLLTGYTVFIAMSYMIKKCVSKNLKLKFVDIICQVLAKFQNTSQGNSNI